MLFRSNWEWCCCIWLIYSNIVWYWIVFLSNWYEMGLLIESCSSSIWLFVISIESWFIIEFKYVWSSLNCWWDWICSSHLIVWDGCDEYSYLIQFNMNFICAVWMNMDRIEWIVVFYFQRTQNRFTQSFHFGSFERMYVIEYEIKCNCINGDESTPNLKWNGW